MSGFVRLETDQTPIRTIRLAFCTVLLYDGWAWTAFPDGSGYGAFPHDTDDYRDLAQRLGYGGDTMAYCWEHEVCHSFDVDWPALRRDALWLLDHAADPLRDPEAVEMHR